MGRSTMLNIRNANARRASLLKLRKNASLAIYLTISTSKAKNVRAALRILSITLIDKYVNAAQEINLSSTVKHVLLVHRRSTSTSRLRLAKIVLEVDSLTLLRKDVSALKLLHSIPALNAFSAFYQNISI